MPIVDNNLDLTWSLLVLCLSKWLLLVHVDWLLLALRQGGWRR